MWLVPNRLLYETNEVFDRDYDLRIFVSKNGSVREIDPFAPGAVIEIGYAPDSTAVAFETVADYYPFYIFRFAGRNIVRVTYDGMEAFYSVEVRGDYNSGDDDTGFINIIKWL